ncbi:RNA-binding protein S1 [candidate division WOR-1 bacterium RIFOXYD2_FULL_36_8]|uniref:RNA-binding protein S1 n=1 Tax=candidate division WOR-1 bacterium RIFOXYB2_FULL_36_35 TaxID=1802578 RepID=A0A1F4RYW9_UNCSA|nr:MAG: RNA-binding protein S1 [candidate division WOR-1 bacterium RIFOXYA2_FULL_36_21]OGC13374.1 MAG: RNA-binding protein S1 [candidate division WOR-1 bacterium RIFOXYB2_FULL_36_35]OGC15424.1 MAG: RNA-binding protein S1 [candidate division WOR-1 bacterium RIFOXYA12_FULL_36_13]OGC41439.1 MAG: RNA-binding protein S1 [candidate division WOR-1 bacterium RIFOXYD2_FULL_36_8]
MPIEIGSEIEGKVTGITKYGAFIELSPGCVGLVHISQISDTYVSNINEHLKIGDVVKVKVMGLVKEGKYDLSIKMVGKNVVARKYPKKDKDKPPPGSFEDKITRFLKDSEERLLDLKRNIEGKQGVAKKRR